MKSNLDAPHFADETAAFAYVEAWLWPNGAVCPHCGTVGEATRSKGKTTRPGLWNCRPCRKPFTVRIGTIFESSHVPMRIWLQAIYLICSSKKGISTRQIQRTLGGSMKTAWFLMHRISWRWTAAAAPARWAALARSSKRTRRSFPSRASRGARRASEPTGKC
jgi:transposase-like protein